MGFTRHEAWGIGIAAFVGGGMVALAACQSTDNTGSGGTAGGSSTGDHPDASLPTFTPPGCEFSIGARPEYKEFKKGSAVTAAKPAIRRVRLGLGGKQDHDAPGHADPSTSAGFAWQTDDGTLASDVAWGKGADPSRWSAEDRTSGVTWLTPEGALNPKGDQRMHEAYVCGLEPETTYHYRVGGGPAGGEVWSEVHSFTTTPKAGEGTVKIGISGDSRGQQNDAWRLLQRRMLGAGVNLQLFSGDMINLAPDQGEWEQWLDSAWKDSDGSLLTLGQVLMLAAHGNHDNHTALFYGNLVLPQDPDRYPKFGELFFSVDVGPVHIVVVDDAFVIGAAGDPEYKPLIESWLEADLGAADANRSKVPWIVAMHHHPEYSSSLHGKDADVLRGREFFTPIWDKFHVDMVFLGHDHNYERSKPLTGPASAPKVHDDFADGTVYLVCAGAGADSYSAGTSAFTETSRDFRNGGALGFYAIMTASGTELRIDAHELAADGTDPVFDTFTIQK
jgi:acid phosphatase type 7